VGFPLPTLPNLPDYLGDSNDLGNEPCRREKVIKKTKGIDSGNGNASTKSGSNPPRHPPLELAKKILALFSGVNFSIRVKILLSLCIVILLMGTANVLVVIQMLNYSRQYDAIITNITTANSISGSIKPDIDNEMYNIVAGKTEFNQGKQYLIINGVNSKVQWMMANTDSPEAKVKLDVILRTMQTLTQDVDKMGRQIALNSTQADNQAVLEDIRFVTGVVDNVVQDYVLFEVNRTNGQFQHARRFCCLGNLCDHPHLRRNYFFNFGCLGIVQKHIYPH